MTDILNLVRDMRALIKKDYRFLSPDSLVALRRAAVEVDNFAKANKPQDYRNRYHGSWGTLQSSSHAIYASAIPPTFSKYEQLVAQVADAADFLQREGQIKSRGLEDVATSSKVTTILGLGVGAFFLINSFLGKQDIQLSPGEGINFLDWQTYGGIVLVLIGAIGLYFWIKGSKNLNSVKKSSPKKNKRR